MKKITDFVFNCYQHMNMRLDTLYRSIWCIYIAVAEEIGNIITLFGYRKKQVPVEIPVSVYVTSPGKWSKD